MSDLIIASETQEEIPGCATQDQVDLNHLYVRPMHLGDLPAVTALGQATQPAWWPLCAWWRWVEHPGISAHVAGVGPCLLGVVLVGDTRTEGFDVDYDARGEPVATVVQLLVAPAVQHRGLGRLLLTVADTWAREQACEILTGCCRATDITAQAFALDAGFQPYTQWHDYYPPQAYRGRWPDAEPPYVGGEAAVWWAKDLTGTLES